MQPKEDDRRAGTKNKLGAKQQARRRRDRGAKGAEIETPKVSRGERYGEGVTPPHPTMGLGSIVSSPSGVRSGAPAQNEFATF